jgi:hypothetical protein
LSMVKGKRYRPGISRNRRRIFIDESNDNIHTLSRFTRLVSNHGPTGSYRLRFHPTKSPYCKYHEDKILSRDHILFECNHYTFDFFSFFSFSSDRISLIFQFLKDNPTAFTFEELVEDDTYEPP